MLLYHGSNVEVQKPQIIISNRTLDFGAGFYTTSSEKQANRWSKIQAYRRRTGQPVVTAYEFDEEAAAKLMVLKFASANRKWLDYVSQNRKGIYSGVKYDIAIGPVANDTTMAVLSDYMSGAISERTALILLEPQKLVDQYVFLTWQGISTLRCVEVKYYD